MTDPHLQRAQLLFQQRRYDMAGDACREALLQSPQDGFAHSLLALCLLHQNKFDDATTEANLAIHNAPDLAFAHYALGAIYQERNYFAKAETAAREAVRIEPWDADYWALLAQTFISRQRWRDALDAADRGLEANPEHTPCGNLRAVALVQLGDKDAAARTIKDSLARNPHNALTHANQGWTFLHQGNPKQALVHFGEALRLDPNNEWARDGTVRALKARYLFYRLMLRYYLWMSKFNQRGRWAIIIGLWLGMQLLQGIRASNPGLAPFIYPLLAVYVGFALSSWLVDPIFNLALTFNRYGRYLLKPAQRVGSIVVGVLLLGAVIFLPAGFFLFSPLLIPGKLCAVMVLPAAVASAFMGAPGARPATIAPLPRTRTWENPSDT